MWHVYIVMCSDASYYTGITNNIQHRIRDHNAGRGARYTRSRRPVKLRYQEVLGSKEDALKREAQIKKWPRVKKDVLIQSHSEIYA